MDFIPISWDKIESLDILQGSTFLGEIFNVHPDGFYQFEPLHPFYSNGCQQNLEKKYESLLRKLRCQFENRYDTSKKWKEIVKKLNIQETMDASQGLTNFTIFQLFPNYES